MSLEDRKKMKELIIWSCSDQELERRWKATVKAMEEKGVDYLVIAQRSDYLGQYVKWFTDMPTWENTVPLSFSPGIRKLSLFILGEGSMKSRALAALQ